MMNYFIILLNGIINKLFTIFFGSLKSQPSNYNKVSNRTEQQTFWLNKFQYLSVLPSKHSSLRFTSHLLLLAFYNIFCQFKMYKSPSMSTTV